MAYKKKNMRLLKILYLLLLLSADNFVVTTKVSNYRIGKEMSVINSKIKPTSSIRVVEPSFTGPIENVTGALGKEAALTCPIADLGDYMVAWITADDQTVLSLQTKLVRHSPRYSITNDPPGAWQLHIRQLRIADRGCYMCQINTAKMKKQIGCIDVLEPPNILDEGTSSDVTVQENTDVVVICKASGHPEPRILWRREDGSNILLRNDAGVLSKVDTYVGPVLNITRVDRKQMGAYLCIASNDVPPSVSKRIMVAVNFAPTITVKSKVVRVTTSSNANLECITEANPAANTYWLKSGDEMILSGEKIEMFEQRLSPYQMQATLLIRDLTTDDTGVYTCYSSNAFGKAEGSIRLYEIKTTTTSTTTTTTTTTTTETPTTKEVSSTTAADYTSLTHLMAPIRPAQQKYYTPDAIYGTMQNVIDQSVLDASLFPSAETTCSKAGRISPNTNCLLHHISPILCNINSLNVVILLSFSNRAMFGMLFEEIR